MARHASAHKHLHRKPKKTSFDYVLYVFMIATPISEFSQVWHIFSTHQAGDVSLTTWGVFFISSIAWLIYAIRSKLTPLTVASVLYLVAEGLVVIGILKYS